MGEGATANIFPRWQNHLTAHNRPPENTGPVPADRRKTQGRFPPAAFGGLPGTVPEVGGHCRDGSHRPPTAVSQEPSPVKGGLPGTVPNRPHLFRIVAPDLEPVDLGDEVHPGVGKVVFAEVEEADLVEVVVDDEDAVIDDGPDQGVRVEMVAEEVFIYRREVRQDTAEITVVVGVVVDGQAPHVGIVVEDALDRGREVEEIVMVGVGLDRGDETLLGAAVGDVEGVFFGDECIGIVEGHLGPEAVVLIGGGHPVAVLRPQNLAGEEQQENKGKHGSADPEGFALFFGPCEAGAGGERDGLGGEDRGGHAVDGAADDFEGEDEGRADEEGDGHVRDVLSCVYVKCGKERQAGHTGVGVIMLFENAGEEVMGVQGIFVADAVLGGRDRVEDLVGEDLAVVEVPGAEHVVVGFGEAEGVHGVFHGGVAEGGGVDDGGAAVVVGFVGGVGGVGGGEEGAGEVEGEGEEEPQPQHRDGSPRPPLAASQEPSPAMGGLPGTVPEDSAASQEPSPKIQHEKEGEDEQRGLEPDEGAEEQKEPAGEEFEGAWVFIFRIQRMEEESSAGDGSESGRAGAADEDVVVVGEEEQEDGGEAEADRGLRAGEQDVGDGGEGEEGDDELENEKNAHVLRHAIEESEELAEEAVDVGGARGAGAAERAGEDIVDDEVVGDLVFLVGEEEGAGEEGEVEEEGLEEAEGFVHGGLLKVYCLEVIWGGLAGDQGRFPGYQGRFPPAAGGGLPGTGAGGLFRDGSHRLPSAASQEPSPTVGSLPGTVPGVGGLFRDGSHRLPSAASQEPSPTEGSLPGTGPQGIISLYTVFGFYDILGMWNFLWER